MSSLPRLAIVTPSFNTARYLGAAIQSVVDQDYRNFDYLVMDGGSTDGSLDALRGFGDQIRWISAKDNGQADAVRRGFEQTEGEILAWLNSDDVFAPGAFEAVAEFFAAHPEIDVVYGGADYIDADGRHISRCVHIEPFSKHRLFYYSDFMVQPATFFRRSAYQAVGGIDPELHYALDYDLWLKMAREHSFAHLPRQLASFRWLADNKTATGGFERLDEISRLCKRQGLNPPAYIQLERTNLYARQALTSLCRLRLPTAAKDMVNAAVTTFTCPRALLSLASLHTWHIVWVGQILRRRSLQQRPLMPC